jgi:spore maturation protein CgeB
MKKLKILLVGSNKSMAIERHYVRHLTSLGAEIFHYAAPDIVYDFLSANLWNRILFKTGIYTKYAEVNAGLLAAAQNFQPDVIWVFKGMEIFPATLKKLKQKFKLANYNPDHPFIISSLGSGNDNVTDAVAIYDLHFCYSTDLQKHIEELYQTRTVFLPFGFELSKEDYEEAMKTEEINSVCFLGNPDATRVETIHSMAMKGIPVAVYGHGWQVAEFKKYPQVQVFDATYGSDFWVKLRQYRVQLNIFRKHNIGSHNMRTFEVPAIGGIQLTPYSAEQAHFFKEGEEVFFYRNENEMNFKIRKLLEMDKSSADVIRMQARKRSYTEDYSYLNRACKVYETFQRADQW